MSQSTYNVIDELLDAYLQWRQQSADVDLAYRRWSTAPVPDGKVAFAAYHGALDREELASRCYAELIQRTSHLSADELEQATGYRRAA